MNNWDDVKRRILETADLVEIVGDVVDLRHRGANFVGLCPFHTEKTPSFAVSSDKGIYKCFGCGKSGNVISFMTDYHGMDYSEAIKELARRYAIPLPEQTKSKKQKEQISKRELVMTALDESGKYFIKMLGTTSGKTALSYINKRGFSKETQKEFMIGLSPTGWDNLKLELEKKGFSDQLLLEAGLLVERDGGGGFYDRFRERLMFPIQDTLGKIIGFGARQLIDDKNQPKYINSPQTIVYDKSKVLYGLFQGKNEIRSKGYAILTEGYADVISLYQAGFKNSIASSGTSLTKDQLILLKRYCKKLYIVYDADSAGINATLRAIDLALEEGFELWVVALPGGEDPDSIIREHGNKLFQAYIKDAQSFVEFKYNYYKKEDKLSSPADMSHLIRDIIGNIVKIPDRLQHDAYISRLAALLNLSTRQVERIYKEKGKLESELAKSGKSTPKPPVEQQKPKVEDNNEIKEIDDNFVPDYSLLLTEEKLILKSMVLSSAVADYLIDTVEADDDRFITNEAKRLFHLLNGLRTEDDDLIKRIVSDETVHPKDVEFFSSLVLESNEISDNWKNFSKGVAVFDLIKPVMDSLIKLDLLKLDIELEKLTSKIKESLGSNLDLLVKHTELSQKRKELTNRF